ncbi:MAG: type III pantothenate kinase [Oscillospiraceae bacterium]|jgi:type III pantothenate kinase|nr:type III pantothenate kinase [Oscillospiraceae bacterium]
MLLAIDIGNSNIILGAFGGERGTPPLFVARISTRAGSTADECAVTLSGVLSLYRFAPIAFDGALISSVVPGLDSAWLDAVSRVCGIPAVLLGPGVKTGLNIKIDNPAQLGADLVAGAVAASELFPLPAAVIDLGTATKISALDENGAFLGCVISAGVELSLRALASGTAQLPLVHLKAPARVIGTNTANSMKAGLITGTAAMLDGLVGRMEEELGLKMTAIATGGLAKPVISSCKREIIHCENLVLEGLRIIYYRNR